jgi:hypothetical protein
MLLLFSISAGAARPQQPAALSNLRRSLQQFFDNEHPLISLSKSYLPSEAGGSFSIGGDFSELSSLLHHDEPHYQQQQQYQHVYNQPVPLPHPGVKGRFDELKKEMGNAVHSLRADMLHKGAQGMAKASHDLQMLARAQAESMHAKAMTMQAKAAQPKPTFVHYPATTHKYVVTHVPQHVVAQQGAWVQAQKPIGVTATAEWGQKSVMPLHGGWDQQHPVNVYLTGHK